MKYLLFLSVFCIACGSTKRRCERFYKKNPHCLTYVQTDTTIHDTITLSFDVVIPGKRDSFFMPGDTILVSDGFTVRKSLDSFFVYGHTDTLYLDTVIYRTHRIIIPGKVINTCDYKVKLIYSLIGAAVSLLLVLIMWTRRKPLY